MATQRESPPPRNPLVRILAIRSPFGHLCAFFLAAAAMWSVPLTILPIGWGVVVLKLAGSRLERERSQRVDSGGAERSYWRSWLRRQPLRTSLSIVVLASVALLPSVAIAEHAFAYRWRWHPQRLASTNVDGSPAVIVVETRIVDETARVVARARDDLSALWIAGPYDGLTTRVVVAGEWVVVGEGEHLHVLVANDGTPAHELGKAGELCALPGGRTVVDTTRGLIDVETGVLTHARVACDACTWRAWVPDDDADDEKHVGGPVAVTGDCSRYTRPGDLGASSGSDGLRAVLDGDAVELRDEPSGALLWRVDVPRAWLEAPGERWVQMSAHHVFVVSRTHAHVLERTDGVELGVLGRGFFAKI